MQPSFPTVTVLDVPFIKTTATQLLETLQQRILTQQNTFVVTANPEIVMYAHHNAAYHQLLQTADYITPDGIGILDGAKILKQPLPERITGFDTLTSLLQWASDQHRSAYFVGAKPEVIAKLKNSLTRDYPGLIIAGMHDGYFTDDTAIIADIKRTQPDMVFAALGFPKQEEFIAQHRHVTNGLWMGVGGSFDVLAGTVDRAPKWWQTHHLEWLYRTLKEPKRLKRIAVIPHYLHLVRQQARRQR
ncbi:WecB/TagA/CpsF family glycosyltransferase [Levilactobacillus tujiorum]|uniref:N-acetylglucosaminyldiphosphoundecaprenol N-acetyl-beta-D-mannosaminyltransferase n=1 Tax=Levilactobacillus tujiorum TaxID=2912243 RepID=A0ABX1L6Q1_9LACO|nr:WecB/TagA/CpsF family glycosyltransferase [Levilactobacillus tujiorum]MCH5464898.1 WecB/TagA/CpsF family glycosyltransferase [Levilactobacillus tujiorum]NLR11959.1 WecB/TagA/CpsF family glycosyltransferase [Lactobacillus sp. HBUAS51387]NLR29933.1 WecB/TagA/CpsF family glycosyltransferase [Levilactobacillus tujiorum]